MSNTHLENLDVMSTSTTAEAVIADPRHEGAPMDAMIAATEEAEQVSGAASKLFDLRIIVAALFGFYGLFLTLLGLFHTTTSELQKSGGIRVNLTSGIALLVFSALFGAWALWRPLQPASS